MTTHFITVEVTQQESPSELQQAIEAELKKQGDPLRWAITEVQSEQAMVVVEAIVTASDSTTPAIALVAESAES